MPSQPVPAEPVPSDLASLLARRPAEDVAIFSSLPESQRLAETLVALANGHGGAVVLVVEHDADWARAAGLVQEASLLAQPPLILPLPVRAELTTRKAVVVTVPPGLPHIYNVRGTFWTRQGAQNRPLRTEELRSLLMQRDPAGAGFEAQIVHGATRDDLDWGQVAAYQQTVARPTGGTAEELLLSRGCVRQTEHGALVPTFAGLLLFGRDPQCFLRAAEIIAVRYRTTTMSDVFEREDLGGTLVDQIRLAEAFVGQHMRRVLRISGLTRSEQPEYPMSVVREAIVNAVAHRDYAVRGEGIRLLLFADRLEIYSPGRLPGHVTLDNLLTERYSRNEAIVQVLSDLGYIERLGYGIDRMVRAMTDAGQPAPHFAETTAGFVVTLTGSRDDGTIVAPSPAEAKVNQVLARVQTGQLVLNVRQERALQHLASLGRITNSDFQGLVPDVSAETIRRDLADLVDQGILLKVGEKRATYYILK